MIRPHEGAVEYHNNLVVDMGSVVISEFTFEDLQEPVVVGSEEVVSNGYKAVLFEFFEEPLEVIKIFNPQGKLTGYYCNVNTMPIRLEDGYEITDLYIDIFVLPDMRYKILDEEDFETAIRKGWITPAQENLARKTVAKIIEDVQNGRFPPEIVRSFRA